MTDLYKGMPVSRWYFWDGGFCAIGQSKGVVPQHAHHAIQMCVAVEGVVKLKTAEHDWVSYDGAAVLPDVEHSFDSDVALGCMLLIDPESREGRWLRTCLKQPVSPLPAARLDVVRPVLRQFWEEPPDAAGATEVMSFVVKQFGTGMMPMRTLDERVTKAIELIQSMDSRVASLDEVAAKVFLSPSRFAHLFTEEVGIPFRRYLLWRRLTRAIVLVTRGDTLSRAAHRAGFSDSAHFTRTFYQMFGIPPSAMLNQGEVYEIPAPFQLAAAT